MYVLNDCSENCCHCVLHCFLSELPVFMVGVSCAGQEVRLDDPCGSCKLGISVIAWFCDYMLSGGWIFCQFYISRRISQEMSSAVVEHSRNVVRATLCLQITIKFLIWYRGKILTVSYPQFLTRWQNLELLVKIQFLLSFGISFLVLSLFF